MPKILQTAFIRTALMPQNGVLMLASKTDSDIQVSASVQPFVGFAVRSADPKLCSGWAPIDRLALWIDTLDRGRNSSQTAPPVIELKIYARVNTSHELVRTATWTPAGWDESGILLQVTNRLCTCFEVYARVLPVSGAANVNLRLHALLDLAGPPYDVWHGANVVLS